jgi:CubicO group peptidase (beta-lactamase class C family)
LPAAWSSITIRHLLTHTSGITNDYMERKYPARLAPLSAKQMIKSVADSPLAFQPGEKRAYSNTGYYLLGLIIEKASGKSYADFMKERIFVPLNMDSTCVNDLRVITTNRAGGYFYGTDLRNNEYLDMSWAYSAGAIAGSLTDLVRWDAALYTDKLLPRARLEEMWTSYKRDDGTIMTGVGLGWGFGVSPRYGRQLNHFGGMPGFSAGIERWIDQRLTIIVLANMEVPSWDMVDGVSYFYLPDLIKPKPENQPELTGKHQQLLLAAVAGTLDPELFAAGAGKEFFPNRARQLQSELRDLGRMKSLFLLDETMTESEQHRVRHYRAVFSKESLRVQVELDDKGRVSDLRVAFK